MKEIDFPSSEDVKKKKFFKEVKEINFPSSEDVKKNDPVVAEQEKVIFDRRGRVLNRRLPVKRFNNKRNKNFRLNNVRKLYTNQNIRTKKILNKMKKLDNSLSTMKSDPFEKINFGSGFSNVNEKQFNFKMPKFPSLNNNLGNMPNVNYLFDHNKRYRNKKYKRNKKNKKRFKQNKKKFKRNKKYKKRKI